jgi:hypothetical protein
MVGAASVGARYIRLRCVQCSRCIERYLKFLSSVWAVSSTFAVLSK